VWFRPPGNRSSLFRHWHVLPPGAIGESETRTPPPNSLSTQKGGQQGSHMRPQQISLASTRRWGSAWFTVSLAQPVSSPTLYALKVDANKWNAFINIMRTFVPDALEHCYTMTTEKSINAKQPRPSWIGSWRSDCLPDCNSLPDKSIATPLVRTGRRSRMEVAWPCTRLGIVRAPSAGWTDRTSCCSSRGWWRRSRPLESNHLFTFIWLKT
jgi:hypothetical protein